MPQARSETLNVDTTAYYHCMSRCVRRAFLCGQDPYTGRDFDYRKEWVETRLRDLTSIFAIDVYAYAVMSNHLHVVVKVDRERSMAWSEREVIKRYGKLFRGAKALLHGLSPKRRGERIDAWRKRLWNLSWMMRSLNEWIARRANREDECTGRFWEGRFRCQPLLDERAVVTCMAYVDLNPVRAGICKTPRQAEFTSAKRRLDEEFPAGLAPFEDQVKRPRRGVVPMKRDEYLELLAWTARALRSARVRGAPDALTTMDIRHDGWLETMSDEGLRTVCVLGSTDALDEYADARGKRWVRGKGSATRLFES
ncbi:MAG: hypothetical protein AAGE52_25745 [Myxococcota bacterium]